MATENEPGPWSGKLITALEEAGIIPRYTQRVIIDAKLDQFWRSMWRSSPRTETRSSRC